MKIKIKPIILTAADYHDFNQFADNTSRLINHKIQHEEIQSFPVSDTEFYRAIFWLEGAEDELFEFLFLDKEVWNMLTNKEG